MIRAVPMDGLTLTISFIARENVMHATSVFECVKDNVLRILPPLYGNEDECEESLSKFYDGRGNSREGSR